MASVAETVSYAKDPAPSKRAPKEGVRPRKSTVLPNPVFPIGEVAVLHEKAAKQQAQNARVLVTAAKLSRPGGRARSVPAKKEAALAPFPEEALPVKKPRLWRVSLSGPSDDELAVPK